MSQALLTLLIGVTAYSLARGLIELTRCFSWSDLQCTLGGHPRNPERLVPILMEGVTRRVEDRYLFDPGCMEEKCPRCGCWHRSIPLEREKDLERQWVVLEGEPQSSGERLKRMQLCARAAAKGIQDLRPIAYNQDVKVGGKVYQLEAPKPPQTSGMFPYGTERLKAGLQLLPVDTGRMKASPPVQLSAAWVGELLESTKSPKRPMPRREESPRGPTYPRVTEHGGVEHVPGGEARAEALVERVVYHRRPKCPRCQRLAWDILTQRCDACGVTSERLARIPGCPICMPHPCTCHHPERP